MNSMSYVTDNLLAWALNLWWQVSVVTALAITISIPLRRVAAMRSAVLTTGLLLVLMAPMFAALSQTSGYQLFEIASNTRDMEFSDYREPRLPQFQPPLTSKDNEVVTTFPPVTPSHGSPAKTTTEAHDEDLAVVTGSPTNGFDETLRPINSVEIALGLWILGILLFSARIVFAILKLQRLLKSAAPIVDGRVLNVFQDVCRQQRALNALELKVSSSIESPMTTGILVPKILLPTGITDLLSDDELRLVLTHELAHVVRRYPLVLFLQHLATCLYWPTPLIWVLNRILARAREEACDNYVLQHSEGSVYSKLLLAMAEHIQDKRVTTGAVSLINSQWNLESRVSGLLDKTRNTASRLNRKRRCLLASTAIGLSILVVGTSIGIAQPQPAPTRKKSPNAPQANEASLQAASVEIPTSDAISKAKTEFRKSRGNAKSRIRTLKVLYPLIKIGTTQIDILNLLGAPDRMPTRSNYSRFLSYVVDKERWVEIEFDQARKLVVRKVAHGLDLDVPGKPIGPISAKQRAWLADYTVDAPSSKTTLRAGFIPYKPMLVWGEPLTATLSVANIGTEDFQFMFGGDYRGTGRHNRIKVVIKDVDGNELSDPYANRPELGGISSFEIVTPRGLKFTRTFDLTKFRTIPGPGKYTVACRFSFNKPYTRSKGVKKPTIESTFPLTILGRTPDRISAVLDELQLKVDRTPNKSLPAVMVAIAEFGRAASLPRLTAYINSGSKPHQTAAFAALPHVSNDDSLKLAIAGLSLNDPQLQSAAVEALGRFPDGQGFEALLQTLSQQDLKPSVRESLLQAIGSTKSDRGLKVLAEALKSESLAIRFAAIKGLVSVGGKQAELALRQHQESNDLAFRHRIISALAERLRVNIDPNLLAPILICRRHNTDTWLDSLSIVRIWGGKDAVPTLLSVVDFDVPWSHRNFWILHHVKYAKGAPEFDYHYDPNTQGTPKQHEENRQLLARLKPLAAPRPKQVFWPEPEVPTLKTEPPIDFTVKLISKKGEGETAAQVECGFFKKTWTRTGGSVTFRPTEPFVELYKLPKTVRALMNSNESNRESNLTADQIAALQQLQFPDRSPSVKEGLMLLYIWWKESPQGPIRDRAAQRIRNAVQRTIQQYHQDHVAFAEAARKIMKSRPVQKQAHVQMVQRPQNEVQRIHPKMLASKLWLDLKARLTAHPIKYRSVDIDEDGNCSLNLAMTPTADLSHLQGLPIQFLNIQDTQVNDLSPLKGMPLNQVALSGSQVTSLAALNEASLTRLDLSRTKVTDLAPIAGSKLISFVAAASSIRDLSPLKGMPLQYVDIRNTPISDLSPIVNPSLRSLQIENCPVEDVSALQGVDLDSLWLGDLKGLKINQLRKLNSKRLTLQGNKFSNIDFLEDMNVQALWLNGTRVTDLSPLGDLRLTELSVTGSSTADLAPIKQLKLTTIYIEAAKGLDLSPLGSMPLIHVGIRNIDLAKNIDALRGIKTLKTIRSNGKPLNAEDFWKHHDAMPK